MNGSRDKNKKVPLITEAQVQEEIRRFDTMLDAMLEYYPENEQVWDYIANIRDDVYRLQQALRGVRQMDYGRLYQDATV